MASRPNLLFILSDQHAADFTGFAGDPVARTPHLDALAARAVRFESALCASPLCSPSRMCLLTGKDVHRCAAWNNHWVIFPEHLTWPAHFSAQGYRTCLVGKMHFGGRDQMQGFEDRPYGDLRHGLGHQPEPLSMFPGYAAARSAGPTEIPESLLQDVVVTRETLAYVKEHAAGDDGRPWFVCASYSRPHPPLTAPGRYLRRYRGKVPPPTCPAPSDEVFARRRASGHVDLTAEEIVAGREGYYACIEFLDDCIGELLDGLERDGLLENTIVVYASDHGEMLGSRGIWGKSVYYDPAVRVPLLIAGPGVAADHSARHPVSLIDLYPTTCELAGLPVPEGLDGVSLAPLLADPEAASPVREAACSSYYQYGQTISHPAPVDDGEPHRAWRLVRSADWKLVEIEGGATLLYDLETDPGEERDLAEDPAHAERLASMRALLHRDFSWEKAREQLVADRERLPAFKSGRTPSTPNQYRLPDGREFDAEGALYGARWLPIQPGSNGGIIPQQFG
jgi:choline-sulfatase